MENSPNGSQVAETRMTAKALFNKDEVKQKFQELLGKRSTSFITSVLQIVASNKYLQNADPNSIYQAAAVAATLDLPLNNNLGFAYIVPYNQSYQDEKGVWQKKQVAQFQMGYKGFKQLALRSGQFLTINATDVREGEIKSHERLSGHMEFAWIQDEKVRSEKPIVGYVSYFKLLNGFEQTFFMTIERLIQHGKKYSKSFNDGPWKTEFDGMCIKTVIKLNLSKNAPLSVEMQKAVIVDQSIVNDSDTMDVTYVDNQDPEPIDKVQERISLLIDDAKTIDDLKRIDADVPDTLIDKYILKKDQLTEAAKK